MPATAHKHDWLRVRRDRPCVICGKPDWCTYSSDGRIACCMRIVSERPMRNGGWGHVLNAAPVDRRRAEYRPPRRERRPRGDFRAMIAAWGRVARPDAIRALSARLGVSAQSLGRLGAVWAAEHRAWAFPMYSADRQMIGVRLRAESGRKWAVRGSRNGLFWPEGVPGDRTDMLMICEGPTDVAALLDLGFDVIGRPSCNCGGEMVCEMQRQNRRHVVIVADADGPGRLGAKRLAGELLNAALSVRVIKPRWGKDVRDWIVQHRATRQVIETVVRNTRFVL